MQTARDAIVAYRMGRLLGATIRLSETLKTLGERTGYGHPDNLLRLKEARTHVASIKAPKNRHQRRRVVAREKQQ